jgi:hypothetical protein
VEYLRGTSIKLKIYFILYYFIFKLTSKIDRSATTFIKTLRAPSSAKIDTDSRNEERSPDRKLSEVGNKNIKNSKTKIRPSTSNIKISAIDTQNILNTNNPNAINVILF